VSTTRETLAEQPFLAGLTEHQLGLLAPLSSPDRFSPGYRIFDEGDGADQFWLITDGQVFLDARVPGYDNFVLETLKPPAVLGWSWLFPPYRWHFGAVAMTATRTIAFNGPLVRELCHRDPALGYQLTTRFLQVMGERLQFARRRLQECQRAAGRNYGLPPL
jgi:CRP/FNR family transcriptional regulator, cyclic AMP receptor protein